MVLNPNVISARTFMCRQHADVASRGHHIVHWHGGEFDMPAVQHHDQLHQMRSTMEAIQKICSGASEDSHLALHSTLFVTSHCVNSLRILIFMG